MNANIDIQKQSLKLAVSCLNIIEEADQRIKDGANVDYYNGVRSDAVKTYADVMEIILVNSIEISASFQKPKITAENFIEQINIITDNYRRNNLGINIL